MDYGIEVEERVELFDYAGYRGGAQRAQDGVGEFYT
jgi:hypothetical protein